MRKRISLFSFSGSTHTVAFRVLRFFFFLVCVSVSPVVALSEMDVTFVLLLLLSDAVEMVVSSMPVLLIKPAELRAEELREDGPEVASVPSEQSSSSSEEPEEDSSPSECISRISRGDGPGDDRLAG